MNAKFEQKMARLTKELEAQFEESRKLEGQIRENLKRLDIPPSRD